MDVHLRRHHAHREDRVLAHSRPVIRSVTGSGELDSDSCSTGTGRALAGPDRDGSRAAARAPDLHVVSALATAPLLAVTAPALCPIRGGTGHCVRPVPRPPSCGHLLSCCLRAPQPWSGDHRLGLWHARRGRVRGRWLRLPGTVWRRRCHLSGRLSIRVGGRGRRRGIAVVAVALDLVPGTDMGAPAVLLAASAPVRRTLGSALENVRGILQEPHVCASEIRCPRTAGPGSCRTPSRAWR